MTTERTSTAAYQRRNGFELNKAKTNRFARSKYGIRSHTTEGPYHRYFVDLEERDRVYALLRRKGEPEHKLKHDKILRSETGEIQFQCSY